MSSAKPPFHHVNGRKQHMQRNHADPPHHEIIKYIHDSWKNVCREIEVTKQCAAEGQVPSVSYYKESPRDEQLPLPDFKPFDLDSFVEQRSLVLQNSK